MKYCQHCGTELKEVTKFCPQCGKTTVKEEQTMALIAPAPQTVNYENIVEGLSGKLKTSAIIYFVIAALQLLSVFGCAIGFIASFFTFSIPGIIVYPIYTLLYLAAAILNFVFAIKYINDSKRILDDPTGIVAKYEPATAPIIVIICNFFVSGAIGVIGALYHLIDVREYVVKRKAQFLALENNNL